MAVGNPAGRLRGSRNKLSEAVVCALYRDFSKHGEKAIAKVRRDQPGVRLKVLAMLIPREHTVQHSNPIKDLTDEELEAAIEYIEAALAAKAGDQAKVIEAVPEPVALPAPSRKPRRKRLRVRLPTARRCRPSPLRLNTTVFTRSKSGPVSKGVTIVTAPTTADPVVNEKPSLAFSESTLHLKD